VIGVTRGAALANVVSDIQDVLLAQCPIYRMLCHATVVVSSACPSCPPLGRDLALARRKRRISTSDTAERLFVSRNTLWRLERGDLAVGLGTLATAAFVLQLHDRLAGLAAPATGALALSLDERRLPKHIRRVRS
jgi:hypothetical protein